MFYGTIYTQRSISWTKGYSVYLLSALSSRKIINLLLENSMQMFGFVRKSFDGR